MTNLRNKVEKILLKGGFNADSVKDMMNANFTDAVKFYPEAKASFLAEYIATV